MSGHGYMPVATRKDWETPPDLFDALAAEFGPFDLDPCGHALSYVSGQCGTYYAHGGLEKPWHGQVFVNPPYGREIPKWVAKAAASVNDTAETVVCLLPTRTDTRWWQDCVPLATLVTFIKGRLRFSDHKNSAPFPRSIINLSPSR